MKIEKIELKFSEVYPNFFTDEKWLESMKKYDDTKISNFFEKEVTKSKIKEHIIKGNTNSFIKDLFKVLQKSAMISTFERIAMQNYLTQDISEDFCLNLLNMISDFNETTFDNFVSILAAFKHDEINANIAKWPVVATLCYYLFDECYPVKPTTVKKVAKLLDCEIHYKAFPNFQTYLKINHMYQEFNKHSKICNSKVETHALLYVVVNM